MTIARTPAEVIAGEAVSGTSQERWADMLNIASVIANRAAMLGVTPEQVVSVQNQFNAYNKALPAGTGSLVDMAQAALDHVQTQGPVNNATFYATPAAVGNLPDGLQPETEDTGHRFFSDPAMRAIQTSVGSIRPDPNALPSNVGLDPLQQAVNAPYENNGLLNGVTSLTAAPATAVTSTNIPASALDPAFQPNGLLSGNFPASQFAAPNTPALNNFADLAAAGPMGGDFQSPAARLGLAANPATSDFSFLAGAAPISSPMNFDSTAMDGGVSNVSSAATPKVAAINPGMVTPPSTDYSQMASAGPMQSPISVQASLGAMNQPNLAASESVPMAAALFAPAVKAPSYDVSAQGILGENQALAASTAANPLSSVPAAADLGTNPSFSAEAAAVPSSSEFGDINSPSQKAMDASVTAQLAAMKQNPALNNSFSALANAGPMASPVSAMPTGILGQPSALTASAAAMPTNTGILSGYQEQAKVTPAEAAINGILSQPSSLLSSTPLDTATPNLTTPTPTSSLLSSAVTPSYQQYQSFVPSDVQAPASAPSYDPTAGYQQAANSLMAGGMLGLDGAKYTDLSGNLTTNPVATAPTTVNVAKDPAVSVPSLQTVSVPDQPTIAGPATTTAATQQQPSLSGSFPAAPAKAGLLGGILNKSTLAGGLLGSLVAGPAGGVLGGLLGNQINKNGGLTGLLSGNMPSINNIGGGLQNVQSVYGGAAPGTQANTNNGGSVTAEGGGWTTYTSPTGVTTSFGPNQITASYFGPSLNGTSATQGQPGGGGGFGPGLF